MAREVQVSVSFGGGPPQNVRLEVEEEDVCGVAVDELLQCLQIPKEKKGAWHLVERWRGCERRVNPSEHLVSLRERWRGGGGRLQLKNTEWKKQMEKKKRQKRSRKLRKRLTFPHYFLSGRIAYKKLLQLRRDLSQAVLCSRREYSSILLSRLISGDPLWAPKEPTVLEVMRFELGALRDGNLQLSTEIADLNILSTRLGTQLAAPRKKAEELSEQLAKLQNEVIERRQKNERLATKEMADTQTQLLKVKRELDLRNRLNAVQNTKLQSQKELLAKKRKILEEKQQELEQLKSGLAQKGQPKPQQSHDKQLTSHDSHVIPTSDHMTQPESHMTLEPRDQNGTENQTSVTPPQRVGSSPEAVTKEENMIDSPTSQGSLHSSPDGSKDSPGSGDLSTPRQTTPPKRRTSSTSKKRHQSVFEARNKQLVEEEGIAFRASQKTLDSMKQSDVNEYSPRAIRRLDFEPEEETQTDVSEFESVTEFGSISDIGTSPSERLQGYPHPPLPANYRGEEPGFDPLRVPKPDRQWYKAHDSPDISYREKIEQVFGEREMKKKRGGGEEILERQPGVGPIRRPSVTENLVDEVMSSLVHPPEEEGERRRRRKEVKRVKFAAESLILNAALEGELDLLKECVRELGSCTHTSDKGATCLHNAVCSGSLPTVQYLVEMGCDINAQDVDGWTPLHCAVAYSNTEMADYLLNNGASLFLETRDGETPTSIGMEEYRMQREAGQESSSVATTEYCLKFLLDVQNNLGVLNNGMVYALFSRKAADTEELSFTEGDRLYIVDRHTADKQWWLAENGRGKRGLVPCTYLGAGHRYLVIL